MSENRKNANYGYYVALISGFLALALLVGVFVARNNSSDENQFVSLDGEDTTIASQSGEQEPTKDVSAGVSKAENSSLAKASDASDSLADADSSDPSKIGKADLVLNDTTSDSTSEPKSSMGAGIDSEETSGKDAASTEETSDTKNSDTNANETENTSETISNTTSFNKNSTLAWPVQGNVLLPYSMDTTIYFETIDVYKCNPGMVIQAKVGDPVYASYAGTVKSISEDGEYGKIVTVDLGNGYEVQYGQLKDIIVEEGQSLHQGTAIGSIAEPTAMYSKEGANLYFSMKKDEQTINPADYLN